MLRDRRNEAGATMILVAGAMVMMIGMAALVIDGGFAFSERRQAQTAADFAALAALQFAQSCADDGCATDADFTGDLLAAAEKAATEAKAVVAANLPGATLGWASCVDPAPLDIQAPSTDCVSFNEPFVDDSGEGIPYFTRARVVLPPNTFDTFFARVIGVGDVTVSATAAAEQSINEAPDVLPLIVGGDVGHVCVFTVLEEGLGPCDDSEDGNFDFIDLTLYGDEEGENPSCAAAGAGRLMTNIEEGSDHILTADGPTVGDHEACPNRSENPNEVTVVRDNPTDEAKDGLKSRLQCVSGSCEEIGETEIDHRPLWAYLNGSCPGTDNHAEMENCLDDWSGGAIFESDIADDRRFVAIPELGPGGAGDREITELVPVWLESIYLDCESTGPSCFTVFTPTDNGEEGRPACPDPIDDSELNCGWDDTEASDDIEQITAFRLELDMLPPSIQDNFPGEPGVREFALDAPTTP